jgi:hypothetical protein
MDKVIPTAGMMHQVIPITPYYFTSVYVHIPAGIIALAGVIPDMGAMTSLNLASNELGVEGAKIIATCLPKCTYVVLSPFLIRD